MAHPSCAQVYKLKRTCVMELHQPGGGGRCKKKLFNCGACSPPPPPRIQKFLPMGGFLNPNPLLSPLGPYQP